MTNVFPVLSRSYGRDPEAFDRLRKQALAILLGLSIPFCVGILVTAPELVETVFGSGFDQAVTPMRVLALSIPLVSLQAVLSGGSVYAMRNRPSSGSSSCASACASPSGTS